ncbi:MAG: hypothetical protein Q8O89_02940 [Nanoarchaeota archaeon]|nr:hypothetical protein [Nanoarchaeota archaeon]
MTEENNAAAKRKGRPVKSQIRTNIVEILFFGKKMYGYDVYKTYVSIFPRVTMRAVYYNLRKGLNLGEFEIESIKMEKGDYSWGGQAEKTYYKLGLISRPAGDKRVQEYFESRVENKIEDKK